MNITHLQEYNSTPSFNTFKIFEGGWHLKKIIKFANFH